MSFQGDVGGIGLAELLQSLARGRRAGVLTLSSREGLIATLGLDGGVLHLLPEPGEDGNVWKERARQAWFHQPDFRIDAVRTSEIARAHRIERLFQLLDSEGVHFRFDQRALPGPSGSAQELESVGGGGAPDSTAGGVGPRAVQVYCEGVSAEYLLLEYARLGDEIEAIADWLHFRDQDVPCPLDPAAAAAGPERFESECDGASTVIEIADRLACPIRQCRLFAAEALRNGTARLAEPAELFSLAMDELGEGRVRRSAARLSAWIHAAPPGPTDWDTAHRLQTEWDGERLAPVLLRMSLSDVRTLMRRLDHALLDPAAAVQHWRELQRARRHDAIVDLHRIACEFRWEEEEDAPSLRELLEVARSFREAGRPRRAAAILRMAASRMPTTNAARLDIGIGMVAAGLIEEGTPWIVNTARALIDAGSPEKALVPLRTLLEAGPHIREARRLLARARNLTLRRDILRKHSAIGLAILATLAVGAWVQIRSERLVDERLAEVASRLTNPVEAQELHDRYFQGSSVARVLAQGELIRERRRAQEATLRSNWHQLFRQAQLECSFGDPKIGLERALDVPNPPKLFTVSEPWPLVSDLFNGLAARLKSELGELGEPQLDAPQQVRGEEELARHAQSLLEVLDARQRGAKEERTSDFRAALEQVLEELRARAEKRRRDEEERDQLNVLTRQELLYQAAGAFAKAGELERALAAYERLLEADPSGRLEVVLRREIGEVRQRFGAVKEARRLARDGRHDEARAMLKRHLDRPESEPLPWKLETFPAGALAHMADGSARITPFQLETRISERLEISIELAGHVTERLALDAPADQLVWLERSPERTWRTEGRVEALPLAAGPDHVVCDRTGRLARIGADSHVRWEVRIRSLGGIARTPVFLSRRPGFLLVVNEDGEAWIVDSRTGDLEGPWVLGSPPAQGPTPTSGGANVVLRDGRVVTWTNRLKPEESRPGQIGADKAGGELVNPRSFTAGLDVLRYPTGLERHLDSRFTDWRVELRDEVYLVSRRGDPDGGFPVLRRGSWSYVAWEAPHVLLPTGRLWISDEAGLRSYVP